MNTVHGTASSDSLLVVKRHELQKKTHNNSQLILFHPKFALQKKVFFHYQPLNWSVMLSVLTNRMVIVRHKSMYINRTHRLLNIFYLQ